jgi:hypothetical protein
MKKPSSFYGIEINPPSAKGDRLWLGIERGDTFAIHLGGGKQYTAPIEKVYATLQRWHAKEHPTGKTRRRLFTSSEEMRRHRKEHPG